MWRNTMDFCSISLTPVKLLSKPPVDDSLKNYECDHVRHGTLQVVRTVSHSGKGSFTGVNDIEQKSIVFRHIPHREGRDADVCHTPFFPSLLKSHYHTVFVYYRDSFYPQFISMCTFLF